MNKRRSIRLQNHGYDKGQYFVTFDTKYKRKIFGTIIDQKMILSKFGVILDFEINNTISLRKGVNIPVYQIMPDHVHMIIQIDGGVGAHGNAPVHSESDGVFVGAHGNAPVQKLSNIIRGIKISVSKDINSITKLGVVWQRNYFERIIRNNEEYKRIYDYIVKNPQK